MSVCEGETERQREKVCEGETKRRVRENVLARDCQESKHNAHVCACRISSLLQGSLAKETYNFIDPTDPSHPMSLLYLLPSLYDCLHIPYCTSSIFPYTPAR